MGRGDETQVHRAWFYPRNPSQTAKVALDSPLSFLYRPLVTMCRAVNEKWPPRAHRCERLVPSWQCCFQGYTTCERWHLAGESASLGVSFESLQHCTIPYLRSLCFGTAVVEDLSFLPQLPLLCIPHRYGLPLGY